jgi:hypothetical protein
MAVDHQPPAEADSERRDDRSAAELDDYADREELRRRYYGLLQELRVLLPGTQVLVAFLLTVPFNNRFTQLDELGQRLYALALCTGVLAIACLIAPTAFHRYGPRRSRAARLLWSIRLLRIGLALLGVSLVASMTVVTLLVFGGVAAAGAAALTAATLVGIWLALPKLVMPPNHGDD